MSVRAPLAIGVLGVALIGLAASGSGGGSAPTSTTEAAIAGPPVPTTLPDWIPPELGVAGEAALVEVVRHDLTVRGLQFAVDEQQGTVSLADGRVLVLASIAEAAVGTNPTTWPALVSRTLDVLLAP